MAGDLSPPATAAVAKLKPRDPFATSQPALDCSTSQRNDGLVTTTEAHEIVSSCRWKTEWYCIVLAPAHLERASVSLPRAFFGSSGCQRGTNILYLDCFSNCLPAAASRNPSLYPSAVWQHLSLNPYAAPLTQMMIISRNLTILALCTK